MSNKEKKTHHNYINNGRACILSATPANSHSIGVLKKKCPQRNPPAKTQGGFYSNYFCNVHL
jgi:hypothetical protein